MQLRSDTALRATIKSLTDVVLPAVNPDNGPALEQLQIAIGLLTLLVERMPLEFRYDCDELQRLNQFAQQLGEEVTETREMLGECVQNSDAVLSRAKASPDEVVAAVRVLREATSQAVSTVYASGDDDVRQRVSELVLSHAEQQVTRERAWLLPQGWEANPEALPAIEALLEE